MLFNRQILQGLGTDALAVYGVIVNVSTMVQCLSLIHICGSIVNAALYHTKNC